MKSIAVICAAPLVIALLHPDGAHARADRLIGTWGGVADYSPTRTGRLRVSHDRKGWRVSFNGHPMVPDASQPGIQFKLEGVGKVRLVSRAAHTSPMAYWIQPPGQVLNRAYASPVELVRERGRSTGIVRPLPDRIRLFAEIRREPNGSLTASLGNPELNLFRGRFTVVEHNDKVTFTNKTSSVEATFDPVSRTLKAIVSGLPHAITLTRVPAHPTGLYAGPSRRDAMSPPHRADGWRTARPQEVGLNAEVLRAFAARIRASGTIGESKLPIQSLLIARGGRLVFEDYFFGFGPDDPHDMRSASKTVAPMLVGFAVADGDVKPTSHLSEIFRSYLPFKNDDARKEAITLADIMSMRSGLDCDDGKSNSPGNEGVMQGQDQEPDWYRYTLDLPQVSAPGGAKALYCSASLNLAGGAAAVSTHRWIPELFGSGLASRLGIRDYYINLMPTGEAYMGGGLYLVPRDELKLGQLYLNGGTWLGRRVIPQSWVEASVRPYGVFRPVRPEDLNHRYGFGWHVHDLQIGARTYREYAAEGNGGQLVMVVPDLDLVVAVNGALYGDIRWYDEIFEIMEKLLPAALKVRDPQ